MSPVAGADLAGEGSAQREAGAGRRSLDGGFEGVAADGVEEHGDSLRGEAGELALEVSVPVVEGGVEAEFVDQVVDLLLGAGAADHPLRADGLGDLSGKGPDAPRGTADEHGVVLGDPGDVDDTVIGGDTLVEYVFGLWQRLDRNRPERTGIAGGMGASSL